MQYDVKNPEAYLQALDEDWRKETLLKIRAMILAQRPDIKEVMYYKMLGYADERDVVLALNAQKNYVSLYVGNAHKVDPDGSLLEGINVGKGCLRFRKTLDPDDTRINEFIGKAFELWEAGEDIGC